MFFLSCFLSFFENIFLFRRFLLFFGLVFGLFGWTCFFSIFGFIISPIVNVSRFIVGLSFILRCLVFSLIWFCSCLLRLCFCLFRILLLLTLLFFFLNWLFTLLCLLLSYFSMQSLMFYFAHIELLTHVIYEIFESHIELHPSYFRLLSA